MNKKKKKSLVISCLLLIILVGFDRIMMVNSLDVDYNATGGNGGKSAGNCANVGDLCFNYSGKGIRISLVDGQGNQIADKTYDIVGKVQHQGAAHDFYSRPIYMRSTGSNRALKQTIDANGSWSNVGSYSQDTFGALTDVYFKNSSCNETDKWWLCSSTINAASIFYSGSDSTAKDIKSAKTYYDAVKNYLISEKNDPKIYGDLNAFFKALGYTGEDVDKLNAEQIDNIYIQFEPIMVTRRIKITGKKTDVPEGKDPNIYGEALAFYGTITEMTYAFHNQQTSYGASGSPGLVISTLEATPSRFSLGNSNPQTSDDIKSSSSMATIPGTGVGHIKLSDLLEASNEDCFAAIKYINNTYSTNDQRYHDAVAAVVAGNYEWTDGTGNHKLNVSGGYNPDTNREYYWLKRENYEKRTKMGKKASCYAPMVECSTAIKWSVNQNAWENPPYTTYDEAVAAVADGTYFYYATDVYTKDEDGNWKAHAADYVIMAQAYPTEEGLKKENYGDGKAWCGNTQQCEAVVDFINSSPDFTGDADKYHDAISQVRNGTFRHEVTDGSGNVLETIAIDKAYNDPVQWYYLVRANYRDVGAAKCEPNDVQPPTCGGPADQRIDSDCLNGINYFKDTNGESNWLVCETAFIENGVNYSSENTGHVATPDSPTQNKVVGNSDYCQVFCYETIETDFPDKVYNVKAGQTFFWGMNKADGTYGSIKISKVCKTQEINEAAGEGYLYEKWERDYVRNEQQRTRNWIKKGAVEKEKESCSDCSCVNTDSYNVCTGGYIDDDCQGWTTFWSYSATTFKTHSQTAEWKVTAVTGWDRTQVSDSGYSSEDSAFTNGCSDIIGQLDAKINALDIDSQFQSKEENLLEKIQQCTNKLQYVYDTSVHFVFKEPENNSYGTSNNREYFAKNEYKDLLIMDPENPEDGITENTRGGKNCRQEEIFRFKCVGSADTAECRTDTSIWVDYCDQLEWHVEGEWTYKYDPAMFTWYSLKYNKDSKSETLMNATEKPDGVDEGLFYSIGYGLPTAFTLTDGSYKMHVVVSELGDKGEINDADPTYAGEIEYNSEHGHFKALFGTNEVNLYGFPYECTYDVENDIFGYECQYSGGNIYSESANYCDEDKDDSSDGQVVGIDVTYRLVGLLEDSDNLNKAFPGQDGDGRVPGSNWNIDDAQLYDILDANVYNTSQAMYEIFLDIGTIQEIRKRNEDFDGNAYTTFDDVICVGGNEKYCASGFISDLASGVYGQTLYGTCIPEIDTERRAIHVLDEGCNGSYGPLDIKWLR